MDDWYDNLLTIHSEQPQTLKEFERQVAGSREYELRWPELRPVLNELLAAVRAAPLRVAPLLKEMCIRLAVTPQRMMDYCGMPDPNAKGLKVEHVAAWVEGFLQNSQPPEFFPAIGMQVLSLNKLRPIPNHVMVAPYELNGMHWCRDHWGCPQDVLNPVRIEVTHADPPLTSGHVLRYQFLSMQESPFPAIEAAAAKWPTLCLSLISLNYGGMRAVSRAISVGVTLRKEIVNGYFHDMVELKDGRNKMNWQVTTHHADLMLRRTLLDRATHDRRSRAVA